MIKSGKIELDHIAEARIKIFEYIEVFYNHIRLHSTLGYKP